MTLLRTSPETEARSRDGDGATAGGAPAQAEPFARVRGGGAVAPAVAGDPTGSRTAAAARVMTILPIAGLATIAGLLVWAAIGNLGPAAPTYWEQVPAGQPYNVVPPSPKVPRAGTTSTSAMGMGKTGVSVTSSVRPSATKLPPMSTSVVSANVTLRVDPQPLGGNYGDDGQIHDVFSPAFFSVPVGHLIRVTVYNHDDMGHTFTSTALGLNVWIPGGDSARPSVTTFTFRPSSTGNFYWLCAVPCDSYSMGAPGYMQGEIHVVAS